GQGRQGGGGGGGGRGGGPQLPPAPTPVAPPPAAPYKAGIPERTAQDTAITNVRIVVGNGQVIENGHIIMRSGRIAVVAPGAPASTQGLRVINAQGMSAMAGFIDGHKHVTNGPSSEAQMRSLLEAGYTTILAGGGSAMDNLTLSANVESGMINGPRIIPSGPAGTNQAAQQAAAAVMALAMQNVRHTGEINITPEPFPPQAQVETLKAIVNAARMNNVQVNVHAVSSIAMETAIDVGVRRLVHLPNKDFTTFEQAQKVAETGSIVAGLIAFGAPTIERDSPLPPGCPLPCQGSVFFPLDNQPRFRDGRVWPEPIVGANRDAQGRATGTELGYTLINARRIWDADPEHRTISFSTDQNFADLVVLEHELKSFSIIFSMADIHRIIGPNSARYVGMEAQVGTLERGKFADLILLSGNPTESIYGMLTTKVVFKEGRMVIDKR
ncbi:MAG: amidohydrolase family protein, partial [Vicinamibacterales bacterium]